MKRSACPGGVHASGRDGLVEIDVAVANLYVEPTSGVNADPGLKMDRGPLAAIVRERDECPDLTTHTFGHLRVFHEVLLPTGLDRVYHRQLAWNNRNWVDNY